MREFRHVDLFAGVGGFREALRPLGAETVFSSEFDEGAAKCYQDNWSDAPAGDIRFIDARDVPWHDLLTAGFPCQPYSIIGLRRGLADDRGLLFFEVMRLVRAMCPPMLLLENVPGLTSHDGGKTLACMLRLLAICGYRTQVRVLNSSLYGCRTQRFRLYFVCFRDVSAAARFQWPEPTLDPVRLLDVMEKDTTGVKTWSLDAFKPERGPIPSFRLGTIRCGEIEVPGRRQERKVYSPDGHAPTCIRSRTGMILDRRQGCVRMLTATESLMAMGFPPSFKLPSGEAGVALAGNSIAVHVVRAVAREMLRAARR